MFQLTFDPPGARRRLAFVTAGREGATNNRVQPADLEKAESVIDTLEGEPGVAAWVIRSATIASFLDELEPRVLAEVGDRRVVEALSRRGHALLRRIASAPRPVIAAIDGSCLGLGLEVALCCSHRICTDALHTRMGLPQVSLGLIPAAGASFRLPRKIGLAAAVELILHSKILTAKQAQELGLVDEVVGPEALEIAVRAAAYRLAEGRSLFGGATRRGWGRLAVASNPVSRRRFFRRMRDEVRSATHGLLPAPLSALDVIERSLSCGEAESANLEASVFAELAVGEISRSLVATRMAAESLEAAPVFDDAGQRVAPSAVARVGLVGAGTMGADIAVAAAQAGLDVRIREADTRTLAHALSRVGRHWDRGARRSGEMMVFAARCRLSGGIDLAGFSTLDIVLEAVPEDLALKRRVFAELESAVGPHAILATHTQALPVKAIVEGLEHRHRALGLHFFRPLHKMRLCEVVRTDETSPQTLATALAFVRRIGKTAIVVRDEPGFYTTRVLVMYLLAALEMLSEGHDVAAIDAGARRAGWPVGPLRLLDDIGLDVGSQVAAILGDAFPDRARVPAIVSALVARGHRGRASGRGFYSYPEAGEPTPDPGVKPLVTAKRPVVSSIEEIGDRLTLVAALEAVRCLAAGVIANKRDGDVGAVLGIGYPAHRGGPFRHLRQHGVAALRRRLAALTDRFGPRYAAPEALGLLEVKLREVRT